jgi:uncharacterized protein DUF6998
VANQEAIDKAMAKLRLAEKKRFEAIGELKELGVVRSRSFVGDYGEELAKRYYRVDELEPPSNAGYDLVRPDGKRVQVKTLRSTPTNFEPRLGLSSPTMTSCLLSVSTLTTGHWRLSKLQSRSSRGTSEQAG